MTAISEELLSRVSEFVSEHLGLYFPRERWSDLERGLSRAAPDFGYADAASCARGLLSTPLEKPRVEVLASHLTIGETYFFRDPDMFRLLEESVFPECIRKRREAGRYLRVWSAGCATGEEPYSIAMLLRRLLSDIEDWNITILATDINPAFLRRAAEGRYGEWSFRGVPPLIKERFFRKKEKGRYAVMPDIAGRVTFSYHNLARDPYPSLVNNTNAMDLILCRNVLMYFSRDRQKEVVGRLYHCLVDGGSLIVSATEASTTQFSPFVPVRFPTATLYRKNVGGTSAPACPPLPAPQATRETPAALPHAPVIKPVAAPRKAGGRSPKGPGAPGTAASPPDEVYQKAFSAYLKGCFADAEKIAAELLAGKSDHAPALTLLARLRANAGRLPEAKELCEKAVQADKLSPGCHYLLATIQEELRLPEEAAASLRRALYLDHNFALAHFALGNLALRQSRGREAARHFGNALSVVKTYRRDDILPESEGITAGRMEEIIMTTLRNEALP